MAINDYIAEFPQVLGFSAGARYCTAIAVTENTLKHMSENADLPDFGLFDLTKTIGGVYVSGLNIASQDFEGHLEAPTLASVFTDESARPIRENVGTVLSHYRYSVIGRHTVAMYDFPDAESFLDYPPYTLYKLYLPFIGYVDIDPTDFFGYRMTIVLTYNALTGTGNYFIFSNNGDNLDDTLCYTFPFTFAIQTSLGSTSYDDKIEALTLAAINATISISAANVAGSVIPTSTRTTTVERAVDTTKTYDIKGRSNYKGARLLPKKVGTEHTSGTTLETTNSTTSYSPRDKTQDIASAITSAINTINKPYSGSSTQSSSNSVAPYSATRILLKVIRKNVVSADAYYRHTKGIPLGEYHKLENLTGYTKIDNVHIENAGFGKATAGEIDILHTELINGIIL